MKITLTAFTVFIISSLNGFCQVKDTTGCDIMYKDAKEEAGKGNYELALNKLNAAKLCNPLEKKYDSSIIEIYKEINRQKRNAELAQGKAVQAQKAAVTARKKAEQAQTALNDTNKVLTERKNMLELQSRELKIKSDSARDLKNFALAIKHSEKSNAIPAYDSGRRTLKTYLALLSYQLFQQSGRESNKLQTQIYSSLYDALKSNTGDKENNFYWNITSYQEGADHIAHAARASDANKHATMYVSAENSRIYTSDLNTSVSGIYTSAQDNRNAVLDLETNILKKGSVKDKREIFLGIKASPDGRWVAVNTLNRELFLVDHTIGLQSFKKCRDITGIYKFWLDDSTLYAYKQDSGLYMIRLDETRTISSRKSALIEDFTASDRHLYALTAGGIVRWGKNESIPDDPLPIQRPDGGYTGTKISCTADDSLIVWGNENGQVYYLKNSSDTAQHLASFSGPVTDIAINGSGKLVAIANYDKSIRVFNLSNLEKDVPLILTTNEGPVTSVFFDRDNQGKERLVAVISPGFIRLYPMDMETLACKLLASHKGVPLPAGADRYVDQAVEKKNIELPCR